MSLLVAAAARAVVAGLVAVGVAAGTAGMVVFAAGTAGVVAFAAGLAVAPAAEEEGCLERLLVVELLVVGIEVGDGLVVVAGEVVCCQEVVAFGVDGLQIYF